MNFLKYVICGTPSQLESENEDSEKVKHYLSVPKLANILKKIEEVSDLIAEADPNCKRSAKVKQSLQNAVKCYKVIHDEKDSRRKLSDFLGER